MRTRPLLLRLLAPVLGGVLMVAAATPSNAATIVGVCTVTIGEPHGSNHYNGTINAYGKLRCTLGMPETFIRADLESATTIWLGNTESWLNTIPLTTFLSSSDLPCAGNNGTYRTRVNVSFRSPSGVNPAYYFNTFISIWRSVACGTTDIVGPASSALLAPAAPSISLTFLSDGTIREATPREVQTVPLDPAVVAAARAAA